MEKQNSKAVEKKKENPIAHLGDAGDLANWGSAGVESSDILIPMIYVMQPMSDNVTSGKASFGEFVETGSDKVLGKFEQGFDVIPVYLEKVFSEYDMTDPKKKVWMKTYPVTPENKDLPYEDETVDSGRKIKVSRDLIMRFYVLLPDELKVGGAIPYIIPFRRTGTRAGKKLATQMSKNIEAGLTPASTVCTITADKESNDQGTFAVMDVKPKRAASDSEVQQAFKWLKMIKGGKTKVDERAVETNTSEKVVEESVPSDSGLDKF